MKYGKKESGHERKSPEGLAMLGTGVSQIPCNEISRLKLT